MLAPFWLTCVRCADVLGSLGQSGNHSQNLEETVLFLSYKLDPKSSPTQDQLMEDVLERGAEDLSRMFTEQRAIGVVSVTVTTTEGHVFMFYRQV